VHSKLVRSESTIATIAGSILIIGAALIIMTSSVPSAFAQPDACSLLTQAQISAALGVSMGAGEHAGPVTQTCTWYEPGGSASKPSAKKVMLDVFGQMGSLTPADRFNNGKTPIKGITKTPVNGIGDGAYFITTPGIGTALNVKKGSSAFQVRVSGFSSDQIQPMEKAIAQNIVARL
jgi:hypothetical protein